MNSTRSRLSLIKDRLTQMGTLAAFLAATSTALFAQSSTIHRPAPPTAIHPPAGIQVPHVSSTPAGKNGAMAAYSIGDPTNEETYILELINRARANPTEEGVRLATTTDPDVSQAYTSWGKPTRAQVQSDFATYSAKPPLAFNTKLINAARAHSKDMLDNNFQSHTGSDGSSLSDRTQRAGYQSGNVGENIFAYGVSMFDIHASFQIDFGNPELGHRMNIMTFGNYSYSEIGIGVLHGGTGAPNVGPIVTTEDFGDAGIHFITGVVYDDKNSNGFYDMGEGIGGVTIKINGGTGTAVSSSSGAYAIPYSGAGNVSVTASGGTLAAAITHSADFEGENVKIDFSPDRTGFPGEVPLVFPASSQIIEADSVHIVWNKVALATKYHLEVATDDAMKNLIVNDANVTDTSRVLHGLKDSTEYYWRVTATNAKGSGPVSGISSFTIGIPWSPLGLIMPADKGTAPAESPVFKWRHGPSILSFYLFDLSTDKDFVNLVVDNLALSDTSLVLDDTIAILNPNTTYYWRVTGSSDDGLSNKSAVYSFTTAESGVRAVTAANLIASVEPNPTMGMAHINFTLNSSEEVSLHIVNALGQQIATLAEGRLGSNHYSYTWNGSNQTPGMYFYQLRVGSKVEVGRIVLVK